MLKFLALCQSYCTKEDGATAIEYGLIAVGVAVTIAIIVFALGDDVQAKYTAVEAAFH